jgi:hypothetical protein
MISPNLNSSKCERIQNKYGMSKVVLLENNFKRKEKRQKKENNRKKTPQSYIVT